MRTLLPAAGQPNPFPNFSSQVARAQKVVEVTTQDLSSVGGTNPQQDKQQPASGLFI